MGNRRRWTVERGTLWVRELGRRAVQPVASYSAAQFGEAGPADAAALAVAMGLPDPAPVLARFAAGRRCFVARLGATAGAELAAYGWISSGQEAVGELERAFRLRAGDVYIWNCATLPPYQGRHVYSALLGHMLAALQQEGVRRVWIGASLANRPSIKGFRNAGFIPILRLVYRRFYGVHGLWVVPFRDAPRPLFADARRIVLTGRERALGPLVIGRSRTPGVPGG